MKKILEYWTKWIKTQSVKFFVHNVRFNNKNYLRRSLILFYFGILQSNYEDMLMRMELPLSKSNGNESQGSLAPSDK